MSIGEIPIFIINLERRTDRKTHMIDMLEKMDIYDYTFVIPVSKENAKTSTLVNSQSTASKKSHQVTNIKILEEALNREHPYVAIMEDDIEPETSNAVEDINKSLSELIEIDKDFDILSLQTCLQWCMCSSKKTTNVYKSYDPLCGGFRIYSRNGVFKVLKHIYDGGLKREKALDIFIAKLSKHRHIRHYHADLYRQKGEIFKGDMLGSVAYNKYVVVDRCRETSLKYCLYFVILFVVLFVCWKFLKKSR